MNVTSLPLQQKFAFERRFVDDSKHYLALGLILRLYPALDTQPYHSIELETPVFDATSTQFQYSPSHSRVSECRA